MEELIPIVLFLSVAAVAILRPLTSRAGKLLEAIAREKTAAVRSSAPEDAAASARLQATIEHMNRRLDLIEERLDFTERLLAPRSASHSLHPDLPRQERTTDRRTG